MFLRFAVRLPSSVSLSRMGETAVSDPFFQNRIGSVEFLGIMNRPDGSGIRVGREYELTVSFLISWIPVPGTRPRIRYASFSVMNPVFLSAKSIPLQIL